MKNASRLLAMLLAVAMFAAVAFTVSAFEDVNVEDDCYTADPASYIWWELGTRNRKPDFAALCKSYLVAE